MVAFGSKKWRSVTAIPLTMPRPGSWLTMRPSRTVSLADHHDRRRGGEEVEERSGQEPLPGEAHQLVDPHPWQGAAEPDEGEHEDVRLAEEPDEAGDPVEADERPAEDHHDRERVEQDEAEDERLPGRHGAAG